MLADFPTSAAAIRAYSDDDRLLTAANLGVPSDAMSRMHRRGVLDRVIPGVYVGARHKQHALIEVAAWTLRHPHAVACLLTAATFYDLTDAFAGGTWLYVAKGESPPRSTVVPVHVVQTTARYIAPGHDKRNGIAQECAHGTAVRITGPDRTTLDLWRFPRRIAGEHAIEALRRRVRADDFHLPAFARLASRLGVWSKLEKIVQGLALR